MNTIKGNNCRFTLFIVLPWEEVCSVRNLSSGVTPKAIYCRLELLAGCPSYTYSLVSSDGKVLEEDQPLVLAKNVWDGYMVRVQPLDKWMPVYDGVNRGHLDWILSHGKEEEELGYGHQTRGLNDDTTGRTDDVGAVALYISCWLGHSKLCSQLLDAGVDPNTMTPFGRSPMFACTVKDNEVILSILLSHGAKSNLRDFLGETALDIGKKNMCRQCVNRIHSFHINHLQNFNDTNFSRNSDVEMGTSHKQTHTKMKNNSHRKTQSAKITMSSNADLVNKAANHEPCESHSDKTNTTRHRSMLRSNTYSNGFPSNKEQSNQQHIRSTAHCGPPHHSSQTLSTPRNLRYFSDADSSSPSTPRSLTGMATLRVASPKSKYPGKTQTSPHRHNSNNRVRWIESVAYPELQLSPSYSRNRPSNFTKLFTAPSQALPNGLRDPINSKHPTDVLSTSQKGSCLHSLQESQNSTINISTAQLDAEDEKDNIENENKADECSDSNGVADTEHKDTSEGNVEKSKEPYSASLKRTRIWKSRKQIEIKQKERENVEAAKRRIQLSENQKRDLKKRESFEQWLKKKRRQKRREESTDDSDESSDDEEERKRSNIEAFNNWLKELDERTIKQTNPKSAISLHKRKTRALQGLIGISNTSAKQGNLKVRDDASQYMYSYQSWLEKKSQGKENRSEIRDFDERKAKQYLNDMRHEVLAEAVSFDQWIEHIEERKTLMNIISESKRRHSEESDNRKRCQSAKKNLSFEKWRQDLEAKEAKRKIAQLRMRREREKEQQNSQNDRVSTAIPHEAWVQKKVEEEKQQKHHQRLQNETRNSAKGTQNNEDGNGKGAVFEAWANKKHEEELQKVERNLQREHDLAETRQKKVSITAT